VTNRGSGIQTVTSLTGRAVVSVKSTRSVRAWLGLQTSRPGCFGPLITAVLLISMGGVLCAQQRRVAGSRVSLDPPSGFSPARQFAGFENVEAQSSIMVTELPGPASVMQRGMTKAALASRGMTLIESSTVSVDGQAGRLLHVRQPSPSGEVLKWMLIAGDTARTVMIVGTYPPSAEAAVGEAIRVSLLGARLNTRATVSDPFEGLQFRVTPTGRLKLAGRVGNLLALSETGTLTPGTPDASLYFVGHSVGEVAIGDLRAFSERRLAQTTRTRGITDVAGRRTQLNGLDAYELEANATDAKSGRPLRIYQVIAPDEAGYFIIQGFVSPARAAAVMPEFRAVTATFQRTTRQ
jgi:hypothetical protein